MAKLEKIRILVADDEGQTCRRVAEYLNERGFDARTATTGTEARGKILEFRPRFVLADLMLPDVNALELLKFINEERELRNNLIKVLVMSGHNNEFNVRQAFRAGAADYIVKPVTPESLMKRLVFHTRKTRYIKEIERKDYSTIDEASLMLHLTDLVLRQALSGHTLESTLYNLTRMVSMKMDGVRCSVVEYLNATQGIVVTSNDNRDISGFEIDLTKYPEILQVVNTGRLMAIEDIENDPQLVAIKSRSKEINFNALIVCPVQRYGHMFGVLSLRLPPEKRTVTDNEIRFVEIVAHVISLVLSNQDLSSITEFWRRSGE